MQADVGTRSRIPTVTACPPCASGSWPWDSNFARRDRLPIVARICHRFVSLTAVASKRARNSRTRDGESLRFFAPLARYTDKIFTVFNSFKISIAIFIIYTNLFPELIIYVVESIGLDSLTIFLFSRNGWKPSFSQHISANAGNACVCDLSADILSLSRLSLVLKFLPKSTRTSPLLYSQ